MILANKPRNCGCLNVVNSVDSESSLRDLQKSWKNKKRLYKIRDLFLAQLGQSASKQPEFSYQSLDFSAFLRLSILVTPFWTRLSFRVSEHERHTAEKRKEEGRAGRKNKVKGRVLAAEKARNGENRGIGVNFANFPKLCTIINFINHVLTYRAFAFTYCNGKTHYDPRIVRKQIFRHKLLLSTVFRKKRLYKIRDLFLAQLGQSASKQPEFSYQSLDFSAFLRLSILVTPFWTRLSFRVSEHERHTAEKRKEEGRAGRKNKVKGRVLAAEKARNGENRGIGVNFANFPKLCTIINFINHVLTYRAFAFTYCNGKTHYDPRIVRKQIFRHKLLLSTVFRKRKKETHNRAERAFLLIRREPNLEMRKKR
ncbi:hypothetical protein EGR_07557 [Echinococcus granulosus]|uniref:Uncharacterized protein n=1 Tax=Echinococcus granulosus TaxID=6210 RepID=W6U9B7_ECHGR|nr:hypothetical protein EGR_07557 [Echinococcus granulosus]EUB57615.1 hypothetical protein EGR_07557 [Echinococcus granulosus]